MILKIAWRNIGRNKRRSIIVLGSVVAGVIALIFMDTFMNGMMYQMLFNRVSTNISHIQIHKKGFHNNKVVKDFIPGYQSAESKIKTVKGINSVSKRVIAFGLISSATSSSGVYIYGVNPEEEKSVSIIDESLKDGEYLSGGSREIMLGQKLADKLNVSLGDKVVAMSNQIDGSIGSEVFRVVGIFKTSSSEFERTYIYIPAADAQRMLNVNDKIYEFAVITDNYENVDQIKERLITELPADFEVLTYKDLLPTLIIQMDYYKETVLIVIMIVGLALIFGIINTMLMSVFERINEFGVLMAIGMKNRKIFGMIVTEAFIIGIIGTIVGLVISMVIQWRLASVGLDLSMFSESLNSFGVGAVIYPRLDIENLLLSVISIPVITVIGALYPAYKAVKLEPVYAIRYV
ncbi:MAG: ABC transporter permease [Melioribacteraceae bacterium]|nr:ABC transporter permease [Melioribacteraceae bacterium]MCF8354028.1 ABC transporter permease [Melioribacteraceae bacterium]MCF8392291.1 ABC transporter permease [Melioribacteraceae bacterium]MCF8417623.1 ABC transporter permease [Melioribacteraceae bacterium]